MFLAALGLRWSHRAIILEYYAGFRNEPISVRQKGPLSNGSVHLCKGPQCSLLFKSRALRPKLAAYATMTWPLRPRHGGKNICGWAKTTLMHVAR